ncbi:protein argonaute-2 isoform X2 [Mycetomoellerius zeteki]|nr:PREDICTED: protein argonaute-2-like isoform X2 [Trachymyrmex zeteki]
MTKKGKKKKQAAAASKQTSDKKSQEQSQQQQEEQEQTSPEALPSSSTQQKATKGKKEQEAVASTSKQTSDKKSQESLQQQQEKWEQTSPEALPDSSKKQKTFKDPKKQQQVIPDQPQQQPQGAWSHPQQQIPQSQPQQQLLQSQPQQQPQGVWSRPRQQIPQSQPQQQPQVAWSQPQQQPQETWGQPQQQVPQGQPQQQQLQGAWGRSQQVPQGQPQGAWSHSRQQVPQSQPQQQQLQGAWGRSQQVPQSLPQQHQLQGAISRGQSLPQQQQQQPAWGPQRQTAWEQQQQYRAPTLPQQQQKALIDTDAAGDHRQVQAIGGVHRQQPSTSTTSLDISELALTDPFHKAKTEKIKMSSEQLKLYHDMIPKRKDPLCAGKIGKNITVFTNMYQILFNDKFVTNAVHYDIDIRPFEEKPSKKTEIKRETRLPKILCRDIFEQCRNKHFNKRFPAYDGNKNAYSANDLPFPDYMQDVFWFLNEIGQRKQYKITLKKVAYIDLSWIKNLKPGLAGNKDQTAIQVLDLIMRHAPESRFINVGRSLYWNIDKIEPLGGGLTLAHGGFLSGVLGWQPYLNVDVAHKGFTINLRVLEYIAEVTKVSEENLSYNDVMKYKNKILGFLKGLKVTYAIPNSPISKRTYRVLDLWSDSCDSHTFTSSDVTYTITRYFREMKRYNIKRTDLPTLHVGKTSNGGKVLVPLELCTIVGGQAINKKLDENQTTNMIKKAAMAAPLRKRNIEEAFRKLEINRSSVMEKEFHLSVSSQMKTVDARVLPPPGLKYANSTTTVEKGVWRLQQFNQAKSLNSWTILILANRVLDDDLQMFMKDLQSNARAVGMNIGMPERPFKRLETNDLRGITNYFNQYKKLQLIIVVIPDYTDVTYGNVKKITEMDIGVLTQCIKCKTLRSCNAATIKNLLQKINSKLNGINHILDKMPSCLSNYPCMLVGADVTHPAPDSKSIPSIAAVAASRNNSAFQYNVTLRLQPPKEEMILDLEAIILSQLNIYYHETKSPPRRLVYYRDGVSEGQLPQVMFYEITAIKNAIKTFNKGNIEVTCMVVQKRHHVRLFPTNPYETDDKKGNVRAGTIVDTTITHPDHIDFYLVSHASIQGTARPTKYRCICNDSKFNEDQLEEMTYFLCHMYARCTRSVSYPAPTYYAHLAAFRGRALLQGNPNFNLADLEREQRNFTMKMGASPMYFV